MTDFPVSYLLPSWKSCHHLGGITHDHEWRLEGDTVVNGVTIRDSECTFNFLGNRYNR